MVHWWAASGPLVDRRRGKPDGTESGSEPAVPAAGADGPGGREDGTWRTRWRVRATRRPVAFIRRGARQWTNSMSFLVTDEAQVGSVGFREPSASWERGLPARRRRHETATLRRTSSAAGSRGGAMVRISRRYEPLAGWKPALPGSRAPGKPALPRSPRSREVVLPGSPCSQEVRAPGKSCSQEARVPGKSCSREVVLPGSRAPRKPALPGSPRSQEVVLPGSRAPGKSCSREVVLPGSRAPGKPALPGSPRSREVVLSRSSRSREARAPGKALLPI